jgi:hypothetical protein
MTLESLTTCNLCNGCRIKMLDPEHHISPLKSWLDAWMTAGFASSRIRSTRLTLAAASPICVANSIT